MDEISQVLVFGDQNVDVVPSLKKLYSLSRQSSLLEEYLTIASESVKAAREQCSLSSECMDFKESLLELCDFDGQGNTANIAIDVVLSTVNQLGLLIW